MNLDHIFEGEQRHKFINSQVAWLPVTRDVINTAEHLIDDYHEHLKNANIAFMFRETYTTSNGKRTIGKAAKIPAQWQSLFKMPVDFIVWLAKDVWDDELSQDQKRALIDHELCHCVMKDFSPALRGHDVEEFTAIIDRRGLWHPDLEKFAKKVQSYQLPLAALSDKRGRVVTLPDVDQ